MKVLILENIRSVENTGSIFRTADGLGVDKIYLVGTTPAPIDRFGRKRKDFAKVSLGAEETVSWEHAEKVVDVISILKSQGLRIIALEQSENSVDISTINPETNFALIVGNEVDGVSESAVEHSDMVVEIPMLGRKESFNVSVATGIALFVLK